MHKSSDLSGLRLLAEAEINTAAQRNRVLNEVCSELGRLDAQFVFSKDHVKDATVYIWYHRTNPYIIQLTHGPSGTEGAIILSANSVNEGRPELHFVTGSTINYHPELLLALIDDIERHERKAIEAARKEAVAKYGSYTALTRLTSAVFGLKLPKDYMLDRQDGALYVDKTAS